MTELAIDRMYKAEDGSALRFFWATDRNNFQSEQLGRPVHDSVLYVEVFSPGSRESSPVHEVLRKFDKETKLGTHENRNIYDRYRAQIKAFLENDESAAVTGTPLEQLTFLDRNMVATLKESRVYTAEGLAALPDEKLRVLGLGGRTIRDQAIAFMENAKSGEGTAKLAAEVNDLREELARLKERAETAEAKVVELEKGTEKGGANPPPPPPPAKTGKAKSDDII